MVNQYVLKVYPLGLGNEVYRTLEICGDSTLDQLCDAIMEAFDFFHEHLYEFCMDNKMFHRMHGVRDGGRRRRGAARAGTDAPA